MISGDEIVAVIIWHSNRRILLAKNALSDYYFLTKKKKIRFARPKNKNLRRRWPSGWPPSGSTRSQLPENMLFDPLRQNGGLRRGAASGGLDFMDVFFLNK